MEDYYAILGIAPTATNEEINKRYRFLALAYYPDRFSTAESKMEASREMARINAAYDVLSDPLKRAAYDRQREINSASGEYSSVGSYRYEQDSYQPNRKIDEAFQYFEVLLKRWGAYIQLSEKHTQLKRSIIDMTSLSKMISSRLSGQLGSQGIQLFHDDFEEALEVTVFINVALGIELSAASPPIGFDRLMLVDYSVIPIRAQFNFILDYGHRQGVFSSSERIKFNQLVTSQLNVVCQAGQNVGREIALNLKEKPTKPSRQEKRKGKSHPQKPQIQYCQSCGALTETAHLTFRRIIGFFFFGKIRTMKGPMCVRCAAQYFWEYTGMTLLLGWLWLGFWFVPVVAVANWFNYRKISKQGEKSGQFKNPAPGWKTVTLILVFTYIVAGLLTALYKASASDPIQPGNYSNITHPSKGDNPVLIPTATKFSYSKLKPTSVSQPTKKNSCRKWNSISQMDKGDQLCVYGIVQNAYWGDRTRFFITFSDNTTDFRFIVLGGYYFDDVIGYCVEATGIVKSYGGVLYMELGERLTTYKPPGICPY